MAKRGQTQAKAPCPNCGKMCGNEGPMTRHLNRCPSTIDELIEMVGAERVDDCLIPTTTTRRAKVRGGERAHRVALELRLGRRIRPGYVACHTCDVANCVNPDHLWEGTQAENLDDMRQKGRDDLSGLALRHRGSCQCSVCAATVLRPRPRSEPCA